MRLYWLFVVVCLTGASIAVAQPEVIPSPPSFVTEQVAMERPGLAIIFAVVLAFLGAWGLQNRANNKADERMMDRFEVLHGATLELQRDSLIAQEAQATRCHDEQAAFRQEISAHRDEFTRTMAEHRRETAEQLKAVQAAIESSTEVNRGLLSHLERVEQVAS